MITIHEPYVNIFQKYRNIAGLTQEKSAELIGVSVSSIQKWESGECEPNKKNVKAMSIFYNAPFLPTEWVMTDEIYTMILPPVNHLPLTDTAMRFLKEYNDVHPLISELISITCNGRIASDQEERYNAIIKEIDELAGAALSFRYAKQHNCI